MKTCTKCKEEKSFEEFSKRSGKLAHLYQSQCKTCRSYANSARLKERYHSDPEFREKRIRDSNEWSAENPEKKSAAGKLHYLNNKDEYKRNATSWAKRNSEKRKSVANSWKSRNPEQGRKDSQRRRANMSGSIEIKDWLDLCNKYNNVCLRCGEEKKLTQDHVIPLSKGGPHHIDNIQPLCQSCNSKKGTQTIDYRSQ